MRGEETKICLATSNPLESPPRARGRGLAPEPPVRHPGITPACAGKREPDGVLVLTLWNHPRVRGEELMNLTCVIRFAESPPRARGRALWECSWNRLFKNHPRVRGEERAVAEDADPRRGITPACAGKSFSSFLLMGLVHGITPACAGKRASACPYKSSGGNHPRVRGEESNENAAFEGMGIPPKCKFFVLFRNLLRVPCDSRARGSKAIRLSSIRACYMLCVPNTRADHRVFHGGALFVSDIPVIAKWN